LPIRLQREERSTTTGVLAVEKRVQTGFR